MTEDEQSFEDWILATTGQPYHEWLYDRKQEAIAAAEAKRLAEEEAEHQRIAAAEALEELAYLEDEARTKAATAIDARLAALPAWCNQGNGVWLIESSLVKRADLIQEIVERSLGGGRYGGSGMVHGPAAQLLWGRYR